MMRIVLNGGEVDFDVKSGNFFKTLEIEFYYQIFRHFCRLLKGYYLDKYSGQENLLAYLF